MRATLASHDQRRGAHPVPCTLRAYLKARDTGASMPRKTNSPRPLRWWPSATAFPSLVSLERMETIRTRGGSPRRSPTKEAPQESSHVPCNDTGKSLRWSGPGLHLSGSSPMLSPKVSPFLTRFSSYIDKAYSRSPMSIILRWSSTGKALVGTVMTPLLHGVG